MPLRVRFFLWISSIFFLVMVLVYVFGEFEIIKEMRLLRRAIRSEEVKHLKLREDSYNKFLTNRISVSQKWMDSGLHDDRGWVAYNFQPSEYNNKTELWRAASILYYQMPWLDFVQCRINNKLKAAIFTRMPYLNKVFAVPHSKDLTFFIQGDEYKNLNIYIGVRYWDFSRLNKIDPGLKLIGTKESEYWVLFSIDQIMRFKPSDFNPTEVLNLINPYQVTIGTVQDKAYYQMLLQVKENVFKTQAVLSQDKELLHIIQSDNKKDWIKRNIGIHYHYDNDEIVRCYDQICAQPVKSNDVKKGLKMHQSNFMRNQVDLVTMIWMYNVMTGQRFDNTFNPLSKNMPLGLVRHKSVDRASDLPVAFFTKDVFYPEALPIKRKCKRVDDKTECDTYQKSVLMKQESGSIYYTYTFFIDSKKDGNFTEVTCGLEMMDDLAELALFASSKVLVISNNKFIGGVNDNGVTFKHNELGSLKISRKIKITDTIGIVSDSKGNKFLCTELKPFNTQNQVVVVLESHGNKYYNLFSDFSRNTQTRLYHVSIRIGIFVIIFFLIGLFVLDRVIKQITIPIKSLSKASHMIAKGRLDYLKLMDISTMHHDEIGKLYEEFMHMVKQMKRGRKVESVLNKVVSKEIGDEILRRGKINLKGELRCGTVLFADMVKCTELSQEESAIDFLEILNQSFGVLSRVIEDHHGVIDKYIGDAVMSLFGIPIEDKHHELHATLSGLQMLTMIEEMNVHRTNLGQRRVEFGIGIHTGEVVAGNIGAKNRLNYTVVGYPVNSAARICNYAKGGEVIISEEVLNGTDVRKLIETEFHSEITLKGMFKPIKLYRALRRK
jgi:class 3 adenylate cyclase